MIMKKAYRCGELGDGVVFFAVDEKKENLEAEDQLGAG